METTFMTIHNLSPQANIMYASESITDILGYTPDEVAGRSCFDYFHPDEVPFARDVHSRGINLDKAAVLHYARIRGRDNQWIGCECVFTIVYEVLVACTSIYRGDAKSDRRALMAPAVRRLFASSPRDPRYHMLEHLSSKFRVPPQQSPLEPRAALILNRFAEELNVLYATNAVESILGVSADMITGKSFYECIQEHCLPEAIRCLESAKGNDSIAYLRFWRRDPRHDAEREEEQMREASQSSDSDDGGVELNERMDVDNHYGRNAMGNPSDRGESSAQASGRKSESATRQNFSRTSTGQSDEVVGDSTRAIFDQPGSSQQSQRGSGASVHRQVDEPYEIEAVVSCTSDGLVVILRRARPMLPSFAQPLQGFQNGLFAAPWGVNPIRPHVYRPDPLVPFRHGFQVPPLPAGGPAPEDFMAVIREVSVFAWSLVGINGNIAAYSHGQPRGEAQPFGGVPIWDPYADPVPPYQGPENQAAQRWALESGNQSSSSSNKYQSPRQNDNRGSSEQTDSDVSMAKSLITAQTPEAASRGARGNRFLWE